MFIIKLDTDNESFVEDFGGDSDLCGTEIARILRRIADSVDGQTYIQEFSEEIRDINGSTVGEWIITP